MTEDTPKEPKIKKPLVPQILERLQHYYDLGEILNRPLFEQIAAELDCSERYVYKIHKKNIEKFAKPIQKPIQPVSKFADIDQMLKDGEKEFDSIEHTAIEERLAIPPLPEEEAKIEKPEEEAKIIPLTEEDVRGLVQASNIWIKRMLPPELETDEINTLAKVWTPVLNKLMPQWGAEIMAIITTGIIFAPRIYARAVKVKEEKKESDEGDEYDKFAK